MTNRTIAEPWPFRFYNGLHRTAVACCAVIAILVAVAAGSLVFRRTTR